MESDQNNQTYNVQNELRKYRLKRYLQQQATVLSKKVENAIDEGDPLLQYDIDGTNSITREERQEDPDPARYLKEVRQLVNVTSRNRLQRKLIPLTHGWLQQHFPQVLEKYWDQCEGRFIDPQGLVGHLNKISVCAPQDCLPCGSSSHGGSSSHSGSSSCGGSSQINCFAMMEIGVGADKHSVPARFVWLNDTAGHYTFQLPKTLNNIKTLLLMSSEIPINLPTVNCHNNLIFIDVLKDHVPINYKKEYLLPYLVIQIPPGNYGLSELACTIQTLINRSLEEFSECSVRFEVTADLETNAFLFSASESAVFKICFVNHPRILELSLWYLLGFECHQSAGYVNSWSNLVSGPCLPHQFCQIVNQRPYRTVDLQPHKYLYLAISGYKTMVDPSIDDSFDLFAKVQLIAERGATTVYNSFVCVPKIFIDSPLRIATELQITWLDAWGQVVDFQQQEHSFLLEFVVYVDYLVDSNFSSLRGTRDTSSYTLSLQNRC